MARPRKFKFPIRLEDWLRLALRGIRPEDRWKIFKEWRRAYLKITLKREPTESEFELEIKKWQAIEIYDSTQIMVWTDNLRMDFLPKYRKENRIKRAGIAAEKRWSNKNKKSS
jgi:hypothetical protein